MNLPILVTFPGNSSVESLSSWIKALSDFGCSIHVDPQFLSNITESPRLPEEEQLEIIQPEVNEEEDYYHLSDEDKDRVQKDLEKSHEDHSTPILDELITQKVTETKINMSREVRQYFMLNPGHKSGECAAALAQKFQAHYKDVNDAFCKIRKIVYVLSSPSSKSRSLEKRLGGDGFFVIEK